LLFWIKLQLCFLRKIRVCFVIKIIRFIGMQTILANFQMRQ